MVVSEQRRRGAELNYQRILAERLSAVTAEAVGRGPNSRQQRELDMEVATAREVFLATQAQLDNRAPKIWIKNPLYIIVPALGLVIVETAMNRVVVEMVAPVPGWVAVLIATAFSGLLVAFAHWSGAAIRQMWSEISRSFVPTNVAVGFGLAFIDAIGVLLVMGLRGYFLTFDIAPSTDFLETAGAIVTLGFDALPRALANPEAIFLGVTNGLGLLLAFLSGIFTRDSEAEYHDRYLDLTDKDARSKREVKLYEKRLAAIFEDYKRPLNRAVRAFVGNGGAVGSLPKDDFKAQRYEAESLPPPPASPTPAAPRPLATVSSIGGRGE